MRASKAGFKKIVRPDSVFYVQDARAIAFNSSRGPMSGTATVEGDTTMVNTQGPAVSTVVATKFEENLPLNGRCFQTLITLSPGVVSWKRRVAHKIQAD